MFLNHPRVPWDVLCVPQKAPPPPPPQVDCPCPVTLNDFINRSVEVTTPCGVVDGRLVFVGDDSIILQDHKTTTIIRCEEICFVRILRLRGES